MLQRPIMRLCLGYCGRMIESTKHIRVCASCKLKQQKQSHNHPLKDFSTESEPRHHLFSREA